MNKNDVESTAFALAHYLRKQYPEIDTSGPMLRDSIVWFLRKLDADWLPIEPGANHPEIDTWLIACHPHGKPFVSRYLGDGVWENFHYDRVLAPVVFKWPTEEQLLEIRRVNEVYQARTAALMERPMSADEIEEMKTKLEHQLNPNWENEEGGYLVRDGLGRPSVVIRTPREGAPWEAFFQLSWWQGSYTFPNADDLGSVQEQCIQILVEKGMQLATP